MKKCNGDISSRCWKLIIRSVIEMTMKREDNVADWRLRDNGDGTVTDTITGERGVVLPSSGHSWKDVVFEESD